MILNIKHVTDFEAITQHKQKVINDNNTRENAKCINHTSKIHDKVLLECHDARKYESPYLGPFEVTDVFTNATVTIKNRAVYERVNIRRLIPFCT